MQFYVFIIKNTVNDIPHNLLQLHEGHVTMDFQKINKKHETKIVNGHVIKEYST